VAGFEHEWASDAFGTANDHRVPLPALVIATCASRDGRHLTGRFDGGRLWLALDHRVSDGVTSDELHMVATVIEPTREAERSLRNLPLVIPERDDTVSHLCRYRSVISDLFDGAVSVDRVRGAVGGGCWPLDLDGIDRLTDGAVTREQLDGWVEPIGDRQPWFFGVAWNLLVLADGPHEL
jgi:hypothetical protein